MFNERYIHKLFFHILYGRSLNPFYSNIRNTITIAPNSHLRFFSNTFNLLHSLTLLIFPLSEKEMCYGFLNSYGLSSLYKKLILCDEDDVLKNFLKKEGWFWNIILFIPRMFTNFCLFFSDYAFLINILLFGLCFWTNFGGKYLTIIFLLFSLDAEILFTKHLTAKYLHFFSFLRLCVWIFCASLFIFSYFNFKFVDNILQIYIVLIGLKSLLFYLDLADITSHFAFRLFTDDHIFYDKTYEISEQAIILSLIILYLKQELEGVKTPLLQIFLITNLIIFVIF